MNQSDNPDFFREYAQMARIRYDLEEAMPPRQWRDQMAEEMRRPMMLLVKAAKP